MVERLEALLRADAAAFRRAPSANLARAVRAAIDAGCVPERERPRLVPLAAAAGLLLALGTIWLARRPSAPLPSRGTAALVEAILPGELRAAFVEAARDLGDPMRRELDLLVGDARRLADGLMERVPVPLRTLSFLKD